MKHVCRLLVLGLVVAPTWALADDKDKANEAVDKKTAEVMKKLGKLYKDAKSLHTEGVVETTVEVEGEDKREIRVKTTVDFERPNRFALRSTLADDPAAGPHMVCDGKNLYAHARRMKQYTEAKAPQNLSGISQPLFSLGRPMTGMLFQNVLADDPDEALLDGVNKGEYAGTAKVDGKTCHHLKFKQDNLDWELWVAADGEPFVLKAKSVSPAGQDGDGRAVTVETYTKWKVNGEMAKDVFEFKAPEDSKKVRVIGAGRKDG